MKFKLQAQELNEALGVVGIVTPRPVTPQGAAGFLFVVRDGRCYIYSRDAQHQARVDVGVDDVEGEGAFIYPADKVSALKYLDGWIEFEAGHETEGDRHWVRYHAEGGASEERTTIDPRLMQTIDESLEKATSENVYPAALLREGISMTRAFLAAPNDGRARENFKSLQLFDDSKDSWKDGNGHLFAADGVRACFFFCDAFQGKGLGVHGQHLPLLTSFLAKCSGDVTLKHGEGVTYAINSAGQVLGWAHHVTQHEKFAYYPYTRDKFVLKAPKEVLVKALKFVRAGLDPKKDKIRVVYDHSSKTVQFLTSEGTGKATSMPVGVEPVADDSKGGGDKSGSEDFAANANVNQLLELFEPLRGFQADLRVAVIPAKNGRKEAHLFRTVEEFWLDPNGKTLISPDDAEKAYECRITRFMPSRE